MFPAISHTLVSNWAKSARPFAPQASRNCSLDHMLVLFLLDSDDDAIDNEYMLVHIGGKCSSSECVCVFVVGKIASEPTL